MSADTIYQQLRSHLAYLKLAAAADALAPALEAAEREKPAYTHPPLAGRCPTMTAARSDSPLLFIDNRRAERNERRGQKEQWRKPLDSAAFFTRHS